MSKREDDKKRKKKHIQMCKQSRCHCKAYNQYTEY